MTIKKLPGAPQVGAHPHIKCDISPKALEAWNPNLKAASLESDNVITMYDPIGEDFMGGGVTAKRVSAALRSIGAGKDVVVNINSPGGDVFEGLAIYNLLREHEGKVTVKVVGLAASAASFIAMAADEIRIGRAAFFMVHNAWIFAMGNRHDLRDAADWLEPFDAAIADIYAARSGLPTEEVTALMDNETWIGGSDAVKTGWADEFLASDEASDKPDNSSEYRIAAREMDVAMAKAGMPRSKRRSLMQALKSGKPSAADDSGTPSATDDEAGMAEAYADFQKVVAQFKPAGDSNHV